MPVIGDKFYTKAQVCQCEQCHAFFRNKDENEGQQRSYGCADFWLCNSCAAQEDAEMTEYESENEEDED